MDGVLQFGGHELRGNQEVCERRINSYGVNKRKTDDRM